MTGLSNLGPKFYGLFQIIEKVGEVAYSCPRALKSMMFFMLTSSRSTTSC
jgi:hypothetical protein